MNKYVDENRQALANMILNKLEEGVIPWRKPWDATMDAPYNLSNNNYYSGINMFYLSFVALMNNWDDPRWITVVQLKKLNEKIPYDQRMMIKNGERHKAVVEKFRLYDKVKKEDLDLAWWNSLTPEQQEENRDRVSVIYKSFPRRFFRMYIYLITKIVFNMIDLNANK